LSVREEALFECLCSNEGNTLCCGVSFSIFLVVDKGSIKALN
jgi:hypothetical protein